MANSTNAKKQGQAYIGSNNLERLEALSMKSGRNKGDIVAALLTLASEAKILEAVKALPANISGASGPKGTKTVFAVIFDQATKKLTIKKAVKGQYGGATPIQVFGITTSKPKVDAEGKKLPFTPEQIKGFEDRAEAKAKAFVAFMTSNGLAK